MGPHDLLGDRFEIEQQVAAGGMGEVFRARDRVSGEVVAVKVMSDARAHRTARFAREAELLAELSHPGIVRYVGHGETSSGKLFLAMEWLDGEDLKARLEREALTMGEAVTLATRVAEALGVAHARGVVHRDLKPSNLFLPGGRTDAVKVLDFGIAHREGRTQLTQTGRTVGTLGYIAPEQARSGGVIDARADVFALGCVLFECLTGTRPFESDDAAGILTKILFGQAPRVSALSSEVPGDLDALVAQMLAKEPALRPRDGAELAAALAALGPEVHSAAVASRAGTGKPSTIIGIERRLLSVVHVGSATKDDAVADEAVDEAIDEAIDEALRRVVKPYGGRLEPLTDGSTIVVLEADGQVATDQAAQAARCALALRAVAKGRPIAIRIVRAESTRQVPEDDLLGRVSPLVSQPTQGSPGSGELPPIALDEMSAGLLDARFDVIEREAGLMLCGERVLMQGARTLLGRPTSCVGRDWELGALAGILEDCIDEPEARVVVVTAAAGMGKSRLAAEFVSRVQQRREAVAIWGGRGDSLRAGSTLDLLAQALRGAFEILGGEPLAERRDKIRRRVAEHVPVHDQKRVMEFLGELVGTPFPDDGEGGAALRAARQDAQLMSEQMRKAWMDFLDAEAAAHPVVLVLEDLHWGDFGTVRFIDTALRDRHDRPWMVLALARPEVYEVFPKLWAERQNVQEIRLKELGRKAGERLVRQVLGDSVGPETTERIVKQADGNAFYLEELIRAAAEGKDQALPETVLAMVETRLGGLAVEARRVLRAASVFGEVCWESGVVVLLGGAMVATLVGEWLANLVEQEVLTVRAASRFPGERELKFRHALLREGAHATLTEGDQQLGHRLAGEWLEQHGEADPMVLAGHFERGGEGARAASYYLRAAEQALYVVVDVDAAMARVGLGLKCAPTQELRIALLGVRCEASSFGLERVNATLPDAEELMRSARPGSIPWAQGKMLYNFGTLLAGRIDDLLASIAQLREVDPAPEAVGKMAFTLLVAVAMLDNFGRISEGTALEDRFLAVVPPTADREPLASVWWNIAIAMRASYAHEDPWDGLVHCDAVKAIFDVTGGELIFLNMQLFRGLNLWYLGASALAERTMDEIVTADDSLGMVASLRRFTLSWVRADRGAFDEARALATQLKEYGHAHHNTLDEGRGRWVLARVLYGMGDLDAAERELQAALGMAVALEYPGVLGTLSAVRLSQRRADEALTAAEEAVARWEAMGACGLFRGVSVRLAHAEALHATGAHDAARQVIAEARARLFTIADRIVDPAYKQRFLENVPENSKTLALARAWLGSDF